MRTLIVLAVLLFLAPPVSATWGAKGFPEPDTALDARDGFMFVNAPSGNARQVYFNGFLAQGRGPHAECTTSGVILVNIVVSCDATGGCPETGLFPSLPCVGGAVGTGPSLAGLQHQPYPMEPYAILGVWRDCNQDGYIGYGDLGLWEYRSTLLMDTRVCPPVSDPPVIAFDAYPSHNDGTWVRELLPIGWNQFGLTDAVGRPRDLNQYDLNDSESRVWADWGVPDAPSRNNCHVTPFPRDTTRYTGGVIEYVDCYDDFRVTAVVNSAATTAGHPELGFGDAPRDQSASRSPANQKNPWGSNADDAYVETCNGQGTFLLTDPVLGWNHSLKPPTPGRVHTNGSLSGQVKESYWHATWMSCDGGQAPVQRDASEAPYALEGDAANQVGARAQTDLVFQHFADPRPAPPFAGVHRATPDDLGPRMLSPNGLWRASGDTAMTRPPVVSREGLNLAPVQYLTYYARIGPAAVSKYSLSLPGSTGVYGASACTSGVGSGLPAKNGWTCDPTKWWPSNSMPTSGKLNGAEVGVRVGQTFNLRDVDCMDEATAPQREQGLTLGAIAGEQCAYV